MIKVSKGWSKNDWAIPLHVWAGKPYTAACLKSPGKEDELWVTQVVITLFCFYLDIQWE